LREASGNGARRRGKKSGASKRRGAAPVPPQARDRNKDSSAKVALKEVTAPVPSLLLIVRKGLLRKRLGACLAFRRVPFTGGGLALAQSQTTAQPF
jgi:hypothetical protein